MADLWVAKWFGLTVDDVRWGELARYILNRTSFAVPEFNELIKQGRSIAQTRSFFHWELEFPEVFFDNSGKRDLSNGFDAIVGNPPYVRQELFSEQKPYYEVAFSKVYDGVADLYVYFLAQSVCLLRRRGLLSFIAANKWLRADYAAGLRALVRSEATPLQIVDFGHSNIFPGTDTFPCVFVLMKDTTAATPGVLFADASDRLRRGTPLDKYIPRAGFRVPLSNLVRTGWVLEPENVSALLQKLQTQFPPLRDQVKIRVLFGIKTGFNEALYLDEATRYHLISRDPSCSNVIRKIIRGRAAERWQPVWDGSWLITLASSADREWPWSACSNPEEAETVFAATYPALHQHLKPFESELRKRQDRGRFWWELRACDYYHAFDEPKIVVQRIMYHSNFCRDLEGNLVNDSAIFLDSYDPYLLALLNSRVVWWCISRQWPHMKDEALRAQNEKILQLPVPDVSQAVKDRIAELVEEACRVAGDGDADKLLSYERQLDDRIMEVYGLSNDERLTLIQSLPLRDPLAVAESRSRSQG